MKLNVVRRIIREDFKKEDQDLVGQLAFPINQFMEQVAVGLNKNLTIEDNLPFEIKTFQVEVDADGIPTSTAAIKTLAKVRGVKVIKADNVQNDTPLTGAPFCQWSWNTNILTITRVLGLPADTTFSLVLELTN